MGQAMADAVGFKEPPLSVEDSAKGVIEQVWIPPRFSWSFGLLVMYKRWLEAGTLANASSVMVRLTT